MGFWIAIEFLTVIPLPFKREWKAKEIASSLIFFPVVGLLIGVLLFLVNWGLGEVFPAVVTSALTLIVWVLISGAMHLDGLADCCDGLGGSTPQKRLEIMKDSHTGLSALPGSACCCCLNLPPSFPYRMIGCWKRLCWRRFLEAGRWF